MSQQDLASPAVSNLTVAATVTAGLGYPNNRVDAPVAPTGWQPVLDKNLTVVGKSDQVSASTAGSGS